MKLKYLAMGTFLSISSYLTAQTDNPEVYKKHISYLASEELEGRGLGTKGKELAKEYIQNQFIEAGLKPFAENYFQNFIHRVDLANVEATNIIGVVEGTDPTLKNEYIVLGAHYDHLGYIIQKDKTKKIYPGADDNASGVSAIIELAKHLGKEENRPKRSLIFIAFDAEESGLIGSEYFVQNLEAEKLKNIKAMFSFDMVGMLKTHKGIDVKGIANVFNGKELVEKHAGDIKLYKVNSEIEARTDTQPFGNVGIPAVHIFTGLKSPYHKPEDKADLLDYEGIVQLNQFMGKVIADLSNHPSDIQGKIEIKTDGKSKNIQRFKMGVLANIGNGNHLYRKEFYDAKRSFSYGVGVQFNFKLSRYWHLEFSPMYENVASASAGGKYQRHSVVLPLNVELGTPTYDFNSGRVFASAGLYYRHIFGAKDGNVTLTTNDYYSKEWGVNLGLGIDISKFRIGYTYRLGLNSVRKDIANVYQTASFFTLGYRF